MPLEVPPKRQDVDMNEQKGLKAVPIRKDKPNDAARRQVPMCSVNITCASSTPFPASSPSSRVLLDVNVELLELILQNMDCITLINTSRTCKLFNTLVTRRPHVIRSIVARHCGFEHADRWRRLTWLQRLQLEEHSSPFDRPRCEALGFTFGTDKTSPGRVASVRLDVDGPKLLVSEHTTCDVPLLRWRFELRGSNAVEIGVVPLSMQAVQKTLHRCLASPDDVMPCGASSNVTMDSKLPIRLPLMHGSVVEMVARRGSLEVLAHHPPDGQERHWVNDVEPKKYRGPIRTSFELSFPPDCPMKLAITCFAKCKLLMM